MPSLPIPEMQGMFHTIGEIMIQAAIARLTDFTAFCAMCPETSEVTDLLGSLGFSLVFSMPAKRYYRGKEQILPELPAQYHYRDSHGTEVIFLAGRDSPDWGTRYPQHASRWWLYPGRSQDAYCLVAQALSRAYPIQWNTQGSDKS